MTTVVPAAGDVVYETGFHAIPFSPSVDVLKGDVVSLVDGAKVLTTVVGPYGVALEDTLSTETKGFAVAPSTVYLTAGTQGFTAFTRVVSAVAAGDAGEVEDIIAETLDCVVGSALETKTTGLFGKVKLGFW